MFCNQSCLDKGRKQFHAAERDFIEDLYNRFEETDEATLNFIVGICEKRILQALSITGTVERFRELMENSEPKTIFDFDLRGQDELSKDVMNLKIINSNIAMSTFETAKTVADSASEYIDSIDLTLYVKSEDDKDYLKKFLSHLLLCGIRNQFAIVNNSAEIALGAFFQPFGTSFNHSCDPNVNYFLMGNKHVFIVASPIKKGDQLFVSYG